MDCKEKEKLGKIVKPPPKIPLKIQAMIKDDKQFWDFRHDITLNQDGELLHWKDPLITRMHQLFEWLPWGGSRSFQMVMAASIELMEFTSYEVQTLGKPSIHVLDSPITDMGVEMIVPAKWQVHMYI